ncbi:site-specific integrase [Flavobacteriales bacterium]|jgi:integrase/recombinase XerD|nr:site-specific integrase [Flavobacteriales bacterium]
MKREYTISVIIDTRRAKSNGKYPIKLRIYHSISRQQKYYPTVFDMTENDFKKVWHSVKPRGEHKEVKKKLHAIEINATNVADSLRPFTFEQFEKRLYRKPGDGVLVSYHYNLSIANLIKQDKIGTADVYQSSKNSIQYYVEKATKKNFDKLSFYDVTSDWLHDYEDYMQRVKGRASNTVSMYVRALRTLYNNAIADNEIGREYYPFGRRKYQPPHTKKVKKALDRTQLKKLFECKPLTEQQEKAKDFWFLSFACNAMNIKDILYLKCKHFVDEKIVFYREKTKNTSKNELKPIVVYLNEYAKSIINKYGNFDQSSDSFVFDVLKNSMDEKSKKYATKNFTRMINQNLQKLCRNNELPNSISTIWARHSLTTNSIRKGASMEMIQEILGHANIKTTQGYFAGFDDQVKKELIENSMDFN